MKYMNIMILILNIVFFTFFSVYSAQDTFAAEALCGIGKDINISEHKETYQQTDQITNLINTVTGALGGILGGGGSRITNRTIEQLLSIFFTLATTGTSAQGYVCIPERTYNEIVDNISQIILDLQ